MAGNRLICLVMRNDNDLILERMRGIPMRKGTLADRFDPRNPNRKNANDNDEAVAMSEMIERVARALSIADGMHPEACSNDEDETPMWTLYVDDARAAIAAMREPTRAMIEHADDVLLDRHRSAHDVWAAMIDGALK